MDAAVAHFCSALDTPLPPPNRTGCQDSRVPSLEQRVSRLEQSVRQLESERVKSADDDSARRAKLESCVAQANATFDSNLVSNGTKNRSGTYSVSVPVLAEMQRQKQGKIEESRNADSSTLENCTD